jgi:hypothetical protein
VLQYIIELFQVEKKINFWNFLSLAIFLMEIKEIKKRTENKKYSLWKNALTAIFH